MKELVKRAKEGDPQAFTALIRNISPHLYKVATEKLKDPNDVDDAIQETMISAYKNLHELNYLTSFKSWITKSLKNKCFEIKKRKQLMTIPLDETIPEKYLAKLDHDHFESNLIFNNLIEHLDEDERIIYYLKIKHQFTFEQISEELNMNNSTVKSIFYRAKDKLKGKI